MALVPLRNDVVVIPIHDPDVTSSGLIHVPDDAKQRVDHGIVKYIGHGVKDIAVGDHVVFSGYSGRKITVSGEGVLYIMEEHFIEAILDDDIPDAHLITLADAKRAFSKLMADRIVKEQTSREEAETLTEEIHERLESLIFSEGYEF